MIADALRPRDSRGWKPFVALGTIGLVAVERDRACREHETRASVRITPRARDLAHVLRALDAAMPNGALVMAGPTPIHVVADDSGSLVRVALPPWRCPKLIASAAFPGAPANANALVLEEVCLDLAVRYDLLDLPASYFGAAPGALMEAVDEDGRRTTIEWAPAAP